MRPYPKVPVRTMIFGGYWSRIGGGGWHPNIVKHVYRYYREGWRSNGYTLRHWLRRSL